MSTICVTDCHCRSPSKGGDSRHRLLRKHF